MSEQGEEKPKLPKTEQERFNRFGPALVLPDADPKFLSTLDQDIALVVTSRSTRTFRTNNNPLYEALMGQDRKFWVEQCEATEENKKL